MSVSPLHGLLALMIAAALASCAAGVQVYDTDGDSWPDASDCGPTDPDIHPGAIDLVGDGTDQDCDGLDGRDADGDGYASIPSGGDDCNDGDGDVHPDAEEEADDGLDNDCTGGDLLCDADGDGLDSATCGGDDCDDTTAGCELDCVDDDGDGVAVCAGDCDDSNAGVQPGAPEACDGLDSDCDGLVTEAEIDGDSDGSLPCDDEPDCDDDDPARSPLNPELCDGVDNDCDPATEADGGEADADGDADPACSDCDDADTVAHTLDLDADGTDSCSNDCDDHDAVFHPDAPDWIGDGADTNCDGVPGVDEDSDGAASVASGGGDCDDDDPDIGPEQAELCDGDDQDCDGAVDEDFDLDGDGVTSCDGDCDDADATVYPGATELCDGDDQDCDGLVPASEVDADGDGLLACAECDDSDPGVSPLAQEVCDGDDENCDGAVDEGFDLDGDAVTSCDGDCDDDNPLVGPDAPELCDGLDSDCDPGTEAPGGELDADGDGRVTCAGYVDQGGTSGGVPLAGGDDCDDAEPMVFPDAYEYCDGLDNDCDASTSASWGEDDADADGYLACAAFVDHGAVGPGGPLLGGLDCDDGDPHRHGGAVEVCDGLDNDCDLAAPGETDADEDRYLACAGFVDQGALNPAGQPLLGADDCQDDQEHRFPGNPEVCDGLDNDCDPATDATFDEEDVDGDGWVVCEAWEGHGALDVLGQPMAGGADCDDLDPDSNPGLVAQWEDPDDGADDGCDGFDGNHLTALEADRILLGGPGNSLGGSMASVGDLDGDGLDDLAVGAYYDDTVVTNSGKVVVAFGATLAAGGPGGLVQPDLVLLGESQHETVGYSVTGVGDVDGDGLDDLAISAPGNAEAASEAGKIYIVLGSTAVAGGTWSLEDVAWAGLLGEGASHRAGNGLGATAGAGDVDGDGLEDLLVGAPPAGGDGRAYLVLGSSLAAGGTSSLGQAHVRFLGASGERAGFGVSSAGDVDGDGLHDVVVLAQRFDTGVEEVGRACLFLASDLAAGGDVQMHAAHASFLGEGLFIGTQAASLGDLSGDGLPELLIGGGQEAGWIVSGAAAAAGGTSALSDAWVVLTPEAADDRFGQSAASAGDVDGDGLTDLLLGAPYNDEGGGSAGKTYLFLGASLTGGGEYSAAEADLALIGEHPSAESGWSVASVGDLNGDGLDDLAVGAMSNQSAGTRAGKVHVLFSQ